MRKNIILPKRYIEADIEFNSVWVSKLINCIMQKGKKTKATMIVHNAIKSVLQDLKIEFTTLQDKVNEHVSPLYRINNRKFGGGTYSIPTELTPDQKTNKGIKFIVQSARNGVKKKRNDFGQVTSPKEYNTIVESLIATLKKAFNKQQCDAIKMKEEIEKTAKANAAFTHLMRQKTKKTITINKTSSKVIDDASAAQMNDMAKDTQTNASEDFNASAVQNTEGNNV